MELQGKTAVVTGGGRGIGRTISLKLATLGANIVLNDIPSSTGVDEVVQEIISMGGKAIAVKGDVRVLADAEDLVNKAVAEFGSVDILVNNAGITRDTFLMRMTEEDWDAVLDINLKGAWSFTKAAAKVMMKQRSGIIVNVASVVGIIGNAGQTNYSSSKAGLIGLTKSVAKELAPRGIRCNAVAPGFITTPMTDALPEKVKEEYLRNIPLNSFGTPEDVANVVAFLTTDASKYITGQVIRIDGGMNM